MNDDYRYASYVPTKGTRWEYEETVMELLQRVDLLSDHYDASGMPVICDGRTAYVSNGDSHGLILGSTGSKKTRLFSMPMMQMFARAGESVLCTDPKGELFEKTSGLYAQEGYRIEVINLRDPTRSHGWNPLYQARQYHRLGMDERATAIVTDLSNTFFPERSGSKVDPFWNQTARALFQGLSELLIEGVELFPDNQVSIASLPALRDGLKSDSLRDGATNRMLDELPLDSLARANLNSSMAGTERTFDNIMVSYNAPMQILYSQRALTRMLSKPEIEFSRLGTEKTVVYLIMPDEKTTLHMLVSLMIKQCYETLIETAQRRGGTLPIRVNFLLDEFSNLPTIPDMSSMISAARSRNIRFYLIVQSMHQLLSKYGDDAYTIRGNCNDWVFLTSRELSLLEELEKLCGTDLETGRPLISVSQLQRLDKTKGEALILCSRLYPFIAHLADIDRYPFASLSPAELPEMKKVPKPVLDAEQWYKDYQKKQYAKRLF